MIPRDRVTTILKLAFPMGIALGSNLVMSLINLAMIGTLGNASIAAVGLASFSHTLVLAVVVGIVPAVQGVVARRRGEGSTEPGCLPLNGGLLIALLVGIPVTAICYLLTPYAFSLISSDPEVTRIGVPYLRTIYLAIVAVGMNSSFEGYWTAIEKPKVFMLIALFIDCLNGLLNYVFIFGHFGAPALGATGAAISTVLSLYTGTLIFLATGYVRFRADGFLTRWPKWSLLTSLFQLAVPAGFQAFFLDAGYLVFFWMLGSVGTAELAAGNVLTRMMLILLLLAMALGNASATLVSRTLGEGDPAGAARWGWDAGKLGVIGLTALGLPLVLFPKAVLSVFMTDPHTITMTILPLQLVGATAGVFSLLQIFAYTLFSVGDGKRVMMVAFGTTWMFFLPAVWVVGPHLHYGLLPIVLVQGAYSLAATALITAFWAGGKWKAIKI